MYTHGKLAFDGRTKQHNGDELSCPETEQELLEHPQANDSTTVSLFHSDLIGITDPSRMLLVAPCKEKAK